MKGGALQKARSRRAFVLMEVLLAMGILATVVTAFALATKQLQELSESGRREVEIQRVLDSALTDAAMWPIVEPGVDEYTLDALGGVDIEIVIEPIEDLETMEGNLVTGLLRVQVFARFEQDGEQVERMAETWRYTRMYQPQ